MKRLGSIPFALDGTDFKRIAKNVSIVLLSALVAYGTAQTYDLSTTGGIVMTALLAVGADVLEKWGMQQ